MMNQPPNDDEFDGPEITETQHQELLQEALRKFWNEQIIEMQMLEIGPSLLILTPPHFF
jgi:hypothetical protein